MKLSFTIYEDGRDRDRRGRTMMFMVVDGVKAV